MATALSMGDKLKVPMKEKFGNPPKVQKKLDGRRQDGRHAQKKPQIDFMITLQVQSGHLLPVDQEGL